MARGHGLLVALLVGASLLLAAGGSRGVAHLEFSPATPEAVGDEAGGWHAHLHAEACGGPHAAPLVELAAPVPDGEAGSTAATAATPVAGAGSEDAAADAMLTSLTTIDDPLSGVLARSGAIDVHRPGEAAGEPLVCGNVTGTNDDRSQFVHLTSASGGQYIGTAWLLGNADDTTSVAFALVSSRELCAGGEATPVAVASPSTTLDAFVIADQLDVGVTLDAAQLDLALEISSSLIDLDLDLKGEEIALEANVEGERVCVDLGLTIGELPNPRVASSEAAGATPALVPPEP